MAVDQCYGIVGLDSRFIEMASTSFPVPPMLVRLIQHLWYSSNRQQFVPVLASGK